MGTESGTVSHFRPFKQGSVRENRILYQLQIKDKLKSKDIRLVTSFSLNKAKRGEYVMYTTVYKFCITGL